MYQLTQDPSEIIRLSDGARVVMPSADSEMFKFAQFVANGGVPLPAEGELPPPPPPPPPAPSPALSYVTPQMFSQDDGADGIINALNSGRPVYAPYVPGGYRVQEPLPLSANRVLIGDPRLTRFMVDPGVPFAHISAGNVVARGFLVDQTQGAAADTFVLRTDLGHVNRVFIEDVETYGSGGFLRDMNSTNIAVYLSTKRCVASLHRGPGVLLRDALAYINLSHVTIDYVGSASRNHIAYSFANTEGLQLEFCDVTSGQVEASTANAHGFFFDNVIAAWLHSCMADMVGGVGFFGFGRNRHMYLSECVTSMCGNHGYAFQGTGGASHSIDINSCKAFGRLGMAYAPSRASGFDISATGTTLTGCRASKNTGNGLTQTSAGAQTTVTGGQFRENGGRGIVAEGGALLASGVLMVGNAGGNYSLSSAAQHIAASQANSGTFVSITGPVSA